MKSEQKAAMYILALAALVVLLILPRFLSIYYIHIFVLIFIYAAAAGAWNIVGGYAGQVSLGHVAFFGIGAYTSTLLWIRFGVSPWIGMFAGGILASLVACGISYPCFKLRGPFFTLATLSFAEVLRLLCLWGRPVTGGAVGLTILYRPSWVNMQFAGKLPYYYLSLGLMLFILFISLWIERSKFGYYLTALKENHDAAAALGINTARYKLFATAISSFLIAICGTLKAQLILYIEPASVFSSELSIQFAMIAVVGGAGTALGPVLGSFLLTPLNELLRGWLGGSFQGLNFVIFGFMLIIVVTFMPNGLISFFKYLFRKPFQKSKTN